MLVNKTIRLIAFLLVTLLFPRAALSIPCSDSLTPVGSLIWVNRPDTSNEKVQIIEFDPQEANLLQEPLRFKVQLPPEGASIQGIKIKDAVYWASYFRSGVIVLRDVLGQIDIIGSYTYQKQTKRRPGLTMVISLGPIRPPGYMIFNPYDPSHFGN
jgi:hypothetical protein